MTDKHTLLDSLRMRLATPTNLREAVLPESTVMIGGPDEPPERYTEGGELGRGGMGSVHLALDRVLRRFVALKRLNPELSVTPEVVQQFVEEARLSSQLEHPNVLPLHDLGIDHDGRLFFTMRVVRGSTLWDMLHDPEMPLGSTERLGELLEIFLKVCDAVSYAHSRGVIHRDIKPDNIMVGQFGEVYLMDWGLAKVDREDAPNPLDIPRPPDSPLARADEGVVGTVSYMAPEQAQGRDVDTRSDVFALGAVLYHIVTGRMPYDHPSDTYLLESAKACNFLPADQIPGVYVQKKMARILKIAMAKDPADRFQTITELKTYVQQFLHGGLHLPRKTFEPGERLVEQGQVGEEAYILTRGQCVVYKMVAGEKRVLRRLGVGDVLGEMGLISEEPRTATVEAVDRVTALVLTRDMLEERFAAGTWEGLLVKSLVDRFRDLDQRLTEIEREKLHAGQ
jgi:hypothetical protein